MQVKGSTFVVTGGASGLGGATVRMVVDGGGNAVIADLKDAEGQALAKELGARAKFVRTDVTDEASAKGAIAAALAAYGRVDGLVNCAGIVYGEKTFGKEGAHSLAGFVRTININLIGTFNMIRLAAEAMAKNTPNDEGERGVIVNTASVAAYDGQIGQAAYAASKAGVAGMTLPIARDLSRNGVRVMTIAPGLFQTPMVGQIPAEIAESLGKMVPFPPRLGRPEEFASLVAEIVRNVMLNGEVIRLDGAIRMAERGEIGRVRRTAPTVALVCFNGQTAARALPAWRDAGYATLALPSSSPAYTRPFAEKLAHWRQIRDFLENGHEGR